MFSGALLAVFSMDLKRTLACPSGVPDWIYPGWRRDAGAAGEENALAVHGTPLHMINHSLIKQVLFMAAGVIFMNAHALDLNEIRGFGKRKPLLKGIFLIGAAGDSGYPAVWRLYRRALLHESIVEFGGGSLMRAVGIYFPIQRRSDCGPI